MFDKMFSRYENHMKFYQLLESSCDVDFKIARTEHCDIRRRREVEHSHVLNSQRRQKEQKVMRMAES